MNIYDTLVKSAIEYPDKNAVKSADQCYTYKGMLEYSMQLAGHLLNLGLPKKAKAIIYLNDSAEFVAALYGINIAGMVFVPVSLQSKDIRLQEIIMHSGAEVIITSGKMLENIDSIDTKEIPTLKKIVLLEDFTQSEKLKAKLDISSVCYVQGKASDVTCQDWAEDEMAAIFYMTDKTGKPKGIMLSTRNVVSNMEAIIDYLKMTSKDNLLILKPMAIVGTVTGEIIASMAVGATIVILSGMIHAGIILKAIQDYKITGFFAIPLMLHQIIEYKRKEKYSTDSLRYIQTGAAKLMKEDVDQLMDMYKGVEFYYIYGLSEASPRVLCLKPDEMIRKVGSVGKPIKNCTVNLYDANKNVPEAGNLGELYVKGQNVMLGYYNSLELTRQVLTEYGLKTGDLAYMDEEGYVYLAGRADNMINQGGFHVYPAEIEKVIIRNKKVKEVKVEGIPDQLLGSKIKATVVPKEGTSLTAEDIYEFCYTHIEGSKIPKVIEIKTIQ